MKYVKERGAAKASPTHKEKKGAYLNGGGKKRKGGATKKKKKGPRFHAKGKKRLRHLPHQKKKNGVRCRAGRAKRHRKRREKRKEEVNCTLNWAGKKGLEKRSYLSSVSERKGESFFYVWGRHQEGGKKIRKLYYSKKEDYASSTPLEAFRKKKKGLIAPCEVMKGGRGGGTLPPKGLKTHRLQGGRPEKEPLRKGGGEGCDVLSLSQEKKREEPTSTILSCRQGGRGLLARDRIVTFAMGEKKEKGVPKLGGKGKKRRLLLWKGGGAPRAEHLRQN